MNERTDEAAALNLDLTLVNPNAEPLRLQEFDYSLSVAGKTIFTARRAALATLPAQGQSQMVLPGVVRYDQTGWTAAALPESVDWSISGVVTYIAPGSVAEILFDTGVRRPSADFSAKGRVVLNRQP